MLTLEQLNAVQLYLGALTVTDIVTDDGKSIMDWALTGRVRANLMIPWPNQNKPSKQDRTECHGFRQPTTHKRTYPTTLSSIQSGSLD
eukprot:14206472-Ditylum_brightwellii.AAC.1